ncbi:MAG: hypothetical protein U0746_11730 [Gemmataceae bacterium]
MCHSVVCAILALAPMQGDEMVLNANLVSAGKPQRTFESKYAPPRGAVKTGRITEVLVNHDPAGGFTYTVTADTKGLIAASKRDNGVIVPTIRSMVRTTYRPIVEQTIQVQVDTDRAEAKSVFSCTRWVEEDKKVLASGGAKLEVKLIEGPPDRKPSFLCTSVVTHDAAKGYTYTHTIENLSDGEVKVRWGAAEGVIKSKSKLTKTVSSDRQAVEVSEPVTVELGGGKPPLVFAANVWLVPK